VFIQDQLHWEQVTDTNLAFYRAIGVDYLAIYPAPDTSDGADRRDYWLRMREQAEKHGLRLWNIAQHGWDSLTLGLPDRDEKISAWCTMLRNLGEAGIPTLGYNFKPVGNFRTPATIGRGGAKYSTFDYAIWAQNPPHHPKKVITEEALFANLVYFLERVLPVAEECGVRMALHPDDPPIPEPMGGAARIVSTLDQYQRIFDAVPCASNAMLFCQGCVTEMGENIPAAIRRIGEQNKIVYVHFRNVRGTPRSFQEVFVDEGDVDMVEAMRAYRDIGFQGPFMMDHTPQLGPDNTFWAGHAYANGYIRALIQAVYR
jgi:mannonate dehydratase